MLQSRRRHRRFGRLFAVTALAVGGVAVAVNTPVTATAPQPCAVVHPPVQPTQEGGHYIIDSAAKLVFITVNAWEPVDGVPNTWWYDSQSFLQTADIDLEGCLWSPDDIFSDYDGGGHTIKGLKVNAKGPFGGAGLFSSVADPGVVKNVILEDVEVNLVLEDAVGGLAGYNYSLVVNSHVVSGTITGKNFTGGLVGRNVGLIASSSAQADVTGTESVGGLVGLSDYDSSVPAGPQRGTIEESWANGTVVGSKNVGGLVGEIDRSNNVVITLPPITNSYALATVSGTNHVGGLIGLMASGTVTATFSTGPVDGTTDAGGLIGKSTAGTVTGSFWDQTTSQQASSAGGAGAQAKTTDEMTQLATFTTASWSIADGFDASKVWGICEWASTPVNGGYPFLTGHVTESPCVYVPELDDPVSVDGGFEVQVLNLDAKFDWVVSVDVGSAEIDDDGLVAVSGLDADQEATATVSADRAGYATGSLSLTGVASPAAAQQGSGSGAGVVVPTIESEAEMVAPSTTVPPTTTVAPTPVVISPVPAQVNGALPEMAPGEVVVYEDGSPVAVEVFAEDDTELVIEAATFELRLSGECDSGCTVAETDDGLLVLTLEADGSARAEGIGFQPGSVVDVWLFSTPTYLGQLTVGADGTFTGAVMLSDIEVGEHTFQVNGLSAAGAQRSANMGVLVNTAAPDVTTTLPATGTGVVVLPWVLMVLVLGGVLVVAGRRTRRVADI